MPISRNWLVRGAQSAFFYYVSCEPCSSYIYRRKRKKAAEQTRKMKDQQLMEQPDLYNHPAPFEINQYWREDIEMGPEPPSNTKRSRKATIDSNGGRRSVEQGEKEIKVPTEAHAGSGRMRKYRRANEEFAFEEETEDEEYEQRSRWDSRAWKAPAVNDLHPPVVSVMPMREADRRWMKMPPPSTDFLKGLKGVTVVEKRSQRRTREMDGVRNDPVQSTRLRAAEIEDKDFEASNFLNAPLNLDLGIDSRPDSGVSTSKPRSRIKRKHRGRTSLESTSASSSDADDEDEDSSLPARPRPVYKSDLLASVSRTSSKRTANRPPLSTVTSQDAVAVRATTPNITRERSNSENMSPRTSPQSHASMGSPISSNESLPSHVISQVTRSRTVLSDQSNESVQNLTPVISQIHSQPQSPRTNPIYKRAHSQTSHLPSFHPLSRPHSRPLSRQSDVTPSDMYKGLALRDDRFDSLGNNNDNDYMSDGRSDGGVPWSDVEEQLAKEHLWLGLREGVDRPSKRWSTDF